ncbi:hypothetical protein GCK32_012346 [Trichostrongylus colubriformis]|uniref:Uncharacterized protein n=1 Tax=Trichostrongylus colubriformis TaxID=6319 RepID=A0AAN8F4W8_TRICO
MEIMPAEFAVVFLRSPYTIRRSRDNHFKALEVFRDIPTIYDDLVTLLHKL